MSKEKDQSIETLRGIAILMVVAGYIFKHDIIPLNLAHPSLAGTFFQYLEYTLSPVRMALFTVISAYLYAASPAVLSTFKTLVFGKFRRVMVPFLFFSTFQFIFFCFVPASDYKLQEIWKIYIWPNQQLWFLFSVFNIFIIVGMLDSFGFLKTVKHYVLVCVIAIFVTICFRFPGAFSIYGTNYLLPFFLLGYGMKRYPELFFKKQFFPVLAIIFFGGLCITPLYHAFHPELAQADLPFYLRRIVGVIVPFAGFPILFFYRRTLPILAFFGYYAFGIHLFHRVSVTATRLVFDSIHVNNPILIVIGYLAGGVVLALIIQVVCEHNSLTRKLILGLKSKPDQSK